MTHDENLNIQIQKMDHKTERYSPNKYEVNFNEDIITNKFMMDTAHLNEIQKKKLEDLMSKYKDLFAKDKYDVGKVKNYEAFIDLQVEKYCQKRPYRCSIEDKREIESQVSKLLKNGLIEDSYSPFAAPVVHWLIKEKKTKKTDFVWILGN